MTQWRVALPRGIRKPFRVFINGVPQSEGADYAVDDDQLIFTKPLQKDVVSKRRWFLGAWGVGTYAKDDNIDVAWEASDGTPRIAHRLDIIPPTD